MYLVNAMYCTLETVNTLQKLEPAVITEKQDRPSTALKVCKHLRAHIEFTSELSVRAAFAVCVHKASITIDRINNKGGLALN